MATPNLPDAAAQQQAAVEVFAQYEPQLYEAYLEMMVEWLAAVKTAMFAGGVASLGLIPDPLSVFSKTPMWNDLTDKYTEQVAREVLAAPYKDLFANGTVFESRPFVRNWIAARANRLQNIPDEVYGLVQHVIDSGTTNGASIPDVTKQVQELFDATGSPTWKNRARTVARTEVVGAYNGGLYDAFSMLVESDPETKWVKRWLATEDHRTRPDHKEADGQTAPWGQPFTVGGFQMQYPHDPEGPPQQVINCRCTMLLEIENEPTEMGNRQYKGPPSLKASAMTLMQTACTDGQFCMQTHKPGLCKGQKRGQREPGYQDEEKKNPAQVAKVAVQGLTNAISQAQAIAVANQVSNPKLAAMARRAVQSYRKALAPHQQTLKEAAAKNDKAKRTAIQDAKQQDAIDKRNEKKRETLKKRAEAIIERREKQAADKAKLDKMTKKQRAAYLKGRAAARRRLRETRENKLIKQANSA